MQSTSRTDIDYPSPLRDLFAGLPAAGLIYSKTGGVVYDLSESDCTIEDSPVKQGVDAEECNCV